MSDHTREPEPADMLNPWKCPGCNEWKDDGTTLNIKIRGGWLGVCVACYEDVHGPIPEEPHMYDDPEGVPF